MRVELRYPIKVLEFVTSLANLLPNLAPHKFRIPADFFCQLAIRSINLEKFPILFIYLLDLSPNICHSAIQYQSLSNSNDILLRLNGAGLSEKWIPVYLPALINLVDMTDVQ
jgi:hypothetical protein